MVGHNANEGLIFTPPTSQNETDIKAQLAVTIPSIAAYPETLDYILDTLYPADFSGAQAQGYTNNLDRTSAIIAELAFTCNTYYLDKAFKNQTYAYLFSAPPALHGFDVPYTFYNANETSTSAIRGVPNPAITTLAMVGASIAWLIAMRTRTSRSGFFIPGMPGVSSRTESNL